MKFSIGQTALVAIMRALGNALGLLGIKSPSAPGTTIKFHFSVLLALFLAMSIGPIAGAITGALSLIVAAMILYSP